MRAAAVVLLIGLVVVGFLLRDRSAPEGPGSTPRPPPPAPAPSPPAPVEVTSTPAPEFAVRVVDEDGRPVRTASVRIWGKGLPEHGETLVPRGGRFTRVHRTPVSEVRIEVFRAEGRQGARLAPATVSTDGTVSEWRVVLPAGRRIEGRVVSGTGDDLPGVILTALPVRPDLPSHRAAQLPAHGHATTAEDGTFRIDGLGDSEYRLRVTHSPGYLPVEPPVVRSGERDVLIRLARGVDVEIRVVDPDGEIVVGAFVFASPRLAQGVTGNTGADGKVLLSGLATNERYQLEVHPPGGEKHLARIRLPQWRPRSREFALPRGYTITGKVVDQDGRSVVSGTVNWRHERGDNAGFVLIGPDGGFEAVRVPEGAIRICALPPDGGWHDSDTEKQEVLAGATGVVLVLRTGSTMLVNVTNRPEEWSRRNGPFGWAGLVSEDEEGLTRRGQFVHRGDGILRFERLPPNRTWTLRILDPQGGRALVKKGLRSGGGHVEAALGPGLEIRGRLSFPEGAEQLRVSASLNGVGVGAEADDEGRYLLRGLTPGRWQVSAYASRGPDWWSAKGEADAGKPLDLVLEKRTRNR